MGYDAGVEPVLLLTKSDLVEDSGTHGRAGSGRAERRGRGIELGEPGERRRGRRASDSAGPDACPGRLFGRGQVHAAQPARRPAIDDHARDPRGRRARPSHDHASRAVPLPERRAGCSTRRHARTGCLGRGRGSRGDLRRHRRDCRRVPVADCAARGGAGLRRRAAIEDGRVDQRRLRSYKKLSAELAALPPPALRREQGRQFAKMVRDVSAQTLARKSYRERLKIGAGGVRGFGRSWAHRAGWLGRSRSTPLEACLGAMPARRARYQPHFLRVATAAKEPG